MAERAQYVDNKNPEELVALKETRIVSGLDSSSEPKPLGEQGKAIRRQILMVVLGNVGVLSLGMGLGLPTVTLKQMLDPLQPYHMTLSQSTWFASLNTLCSPLGGLLSGAILDRIGRKKTMCTLNMLSLLSWSLMALSIENNPDIVYMQLLLSRFVIGVSIGLASAPVGVYAAEISMPKLRGHLILGTSIATALGIMLIYLLGYFIRDNWNLIAAICCVVQIIAFLLLIPLPESPNWLISKGYIDEAKRSLNYFRGLDKEPFITHPEVLTEFNTLQKNINLKAGEQKPTLLQVIQLPEVYKPVLILIGLFAFQQLTGIFIIVVYAVQISENLGVTIDPFICAVLLGAARVLTTCPMGVVLSKLGRRKAGIISAAGIFVSMHLLAGYMWFDFLHLIPCMPVITIVIYMVFSTIGLYTLPFIMLSELFPQKARGPASGLTVAVGLFISFVCLKWYPNMQALIGIELCFVFFGVMGFLAMGYIYFFLPETRGRTLLEIEERFRNGPLKKSFPPVEMQEVLTK